MSTEPSTPYEQMGGAETFGRLVAHFYAGVESDPVLRALYPDDDLGPAQQRLRMFLEQYWGGPRTYSEQRGHPRLRMRHVSFKVDTAARDAWLGHMRAAMDQVGLPAEHDTALWDYFVMAANSLVNTLDEPAGPAFDVRVRPDGEQRADSGG